MKETTHRTTCHRWMRISVPMLLGSLMILLLLITAGVTKSVSALAGNLYVDDASGADSGNCQTATAPCKTINYAINQAGIGDSILIAGGTYAENLFVDQEVSLIGGYEATGWTRDLSLYTTDIDANESDRPITVNDDQKNVVIDGLEIVGGNTTDDGGGIYITGGSVQILNSVIGENTTSACCGGVYIGSNATVLIRDTEISFNYAEGPGGGIGIFDGSIVTIVDSVVSYNSSNSNSGGIEVNNSQANILNTFFQYNDARIHGGMLTAFQSTISFTNTLLTNNTTISDTASVMAINKSSVSILNSTIADNTGAQAVLLWDGTMTMTNSIMWENALNLQADPPCVDCFVVNYSDVQGIDGLPGIAEGIGNFDAAPLFEDQDYGDYHLKPNSYCIDKGTSTGAPGTDIEGNPRTQPPDVGAYEWIGVKIFLPMVVKQ